MCGVTYDVFKQLYNKQEHWVGIPGTSFDHTFLKYNEPGIEKMLNDNNENNLKNEYKISDYEVSL